MIRFAKDVLRPATLHPRNSGPQKFDPARIQRLTNRMQEMIAAKVPIPLAWEHQPDANPVPMSLPDAAAHRSKHHITYLSGAQIDGDGKFQTVFDVEDAAEAAQIKKVKYVSPKIVTDFKDGTGRVWPGESIVHVAVTPRPVDHLQDPVREVPVAFSHYTDGALYLSLGDLEMADETETTVEGGGGADDKFKKAVSALADYGLVLAADVTAETFWDHIITAVETKKATENPTEPGDDLENAEIPVDPGRTVAMSHAANDRLITLERADLVRRINRLATTKRVPKPTADALRKEAETIQLSLSDAGTVIDPLLLAKIAAYEALPQGTSFGAPATPHSASGNGVQLSHATAVPLESGERGPPKTKQETDAALKAWDETK